MDHSQIIVSADNQDADTYYYPATTGDVGLEMGAHAVVGIGFDIDDGTLTIEGCMRRLGTIDATEGALADKWVDITKMFTDAATGISGTASWTAAGFAQANGLAIERIRVKAVFADATNGIDLWIKRF